MAKAAADNKSAKTSGKANGSEAGAANQAPGPLFFKKPAALDLERHRHAGLKQGASLDFARQTNSVAILFSEFVEIARSMPIVFSNEAKPAAVAVLGFGDNNMFILSDGSWRTGHYMPAYIRKYPYALVALEGHDKMALCVDEGAEHFTEKNPDLPFYDGDQPTGSAKAALEFCAQFQRQFLQTQAFGEALKKAGLLTMQQVEVTTPSGQKRQMSGLLLVDIKKWNQLPDATYLEFRKKGYVELVHMVLMSQLNWKYLAALS